MDSSNRSHPNAHLQYHTDYNYPPFRRVMLAAVKEGLYHPRLPSLRRMDMDTATHKLPDEHCRTTTSCGNRDFSNASASEFGSASKPLSGDKITDTGRSLQKVVPNFPHGVTHTSPSKNAYMLSNSKGDWSKFISSTGEFRLPEYDPKYFRFSGYAVRYLKPQVTQSWKYTLQQEPKLDQYSQTPIPANVYSRYRDTFPQYSRNISVEAWR
uniref:TEPP protein n=1 Tax=Molgula tectiformis TaxID=30286 RepID=C9QNU8_MOLTE|nr:TPA_inf: TEPP protein [Molgula tectiformis]